MNERTFYLVYDAANKRYMQDGSCWWNSTEDIFLAYLYKTESDAKKRAHVFALVVEKKGATEILRYPSIKVVPDYHIIQVKMQLTEEATLKRETCPRCGRAQFTKKCKACGSQEDIILKKNW